MDLRKLVSLQTLTARNPCANSLARRLCRWELLPLLGKLYSAVLAMREMRCDHADKPLQSPPPKIHTHLTFGLSFPSTRQTGRNLILVIPKLFSRALFAFALVASNSVLSLAAVPVDTLMSVTTRGFVSIADIHELEANWDRTQLGQLVKDEAMRPFIADMKRQLQRKLGSLQEKLGLELADLKDIAGGEIGLGMIELENQPAAVAFAVNTAGRDDQLKKLLTKIDRQLTKRDATKTEEEVADTELITYTIPPQEEDDITRTAVFFVKDDMLCACDNELEAREMLDRFAGEAGGTLADAKPYQETMQRCKNEAAGLAPELRWFVDPFGYARCVRSMDTGDKPRRGKDYVAILSEQGFESVEGVGGFVNLAVQGSYEILHRTAVFAPPVESAGDEKYCLAMRMMEFPNRKNLEPQKWLPRKLATYRTVSADLQNAFAHVGTLFDAIAGYEGAFEGVLEGLERDPYGPQVKVEQDFIAYVGDRVTLVTDYELPITPQCERFLFAVEVTNEDKIAETVEKFMDSDPNAFRREFQGKVIWEITPPEEEVPQLDIAVADLDLLEPTPEETPEEENKRILSSAVCVADGHMFIASHVEFLQKVLDKNRQETFDQSGDFKEVDAALAKLLSGPIAARCFLRTDEAYRPTYELLRQGRMPESETLLGRMLNRLLTPPEDEGEGILREQKIDGSELPDFEMVRRYFGPAGTVMRSDDDGWFIVGATLTKILPQARADDKTSRLSDVR